MGLQKVQALPVVGVVAVDVFQAWAAFACWRRGRQRSAACGLNPGDCFAHAVASAAGLPLLFKGEDFAQTDVPIVR